MSTQNDYAVRSIPDPNHSVMAQRYGNLQQAVFAGWRSVLRAVAEMGPGSITLSLCFFYDPGLEWGVQGRLRLWVSARSAEGVDSESLDTLLKNGPVSEFYPFGERDSAAPVVPWKEFGAAGEVIRRMERIPSYVKKSENERVPSTYTTIKVLRPNETNDYMGLDRQLSGLTHPAYFEMTVRPVIPEQEVTSLYLYISNLARINESVFKDAGTLEEKHRMEHGFRKDQLAEEIMRENEELVNALRMPQLEFYLRVFAGSDDIAHLLLSCVAEGAFQDGEYRILTAGKDHPIFRQLIVATQEATVVHDWHHVAGINSRIERLPRLAGVDELSSVFRLPVGGTVSPRTVRKSTDPLPPNDAAKALLIGDDMEMGSAPVRNYGDGIHELFNNQAQNVLEHRLPLDQFKKHMFICGVPGSGKTTAMLNLLVQLYAQDIPFLIIEPAKTEYRILKKLKDHTDATLQSMGDALRVYTPGAEDISPFRFNPMAHPERISRDEHINNLMNCFKAAMPMDGPLPALLAEAVELVYEEHDEPYLADLVDAVYRVMATKQYDAEIRSNIETAIAVRLSPLVRRSMGKVFSKSDHAPSIAELMEQPVVIEMDALDQEQANLLNLFLLTAVREHIKATRRSGTQFCHAIVLEEAHNLVGRVPEGASDVNDPREKAASYISRMLAELRALGEGMIIADQLPSAVADAVIKNTGSKLTHRLTSMDDREQIGHTMLAGALEIEELARLQVGEAYFYTEGLYRCRRIRCINSTAFLGLDQPPDNAMLYDLILFEAWFRSVAQRHLVEDVQNLLDNFHDAVFPAIEAIKQALVDMDANRPANEVSELHSRIDGLSVELSGLALDEELNRLQVRQKKLNTSAGVTEMLAEANKLYEMAVQDMRYLQEIGVML